MSIPLAKTPSQRAADVVTQYLETKRARGTPIEVRARLMVLDWRAIGASAVPSDDQVHHTRLWLEDQRLIEAREDLEYVRALLSRDADNDTHRA